MPITPAADLVFALTPKMNHEDMLKEMHRAATICSLPCKLTIQAIICVTMTYEAICSTARANRLVPYVPHTMLEYLALIDRPANAAYVIAVAAALAAVPPAAPPAAITFSEPLADAHDELQNAFNAHVAALRWDVVHVGAGANALNAAQAAMRNLP